MTYAMTAKTIPLKDLALHAHNVRAKSPETYAADNIAHLKASIAALGLIQPLVIQKLETGYGVLAGGRRLAALQALASDKAAKDFTPKTEIDCRLVPEDCDIRTAISLAENITQEQMSPIDQFEAFAAMLESDGQSVETIAMTFGTTTAAVKERLRYGRVHQNIRAAVRAKTLTLDAMKAFGDHPSQDVQLEVYEALSRDGEQPGAWQIRKAFKERGVQVSDNLGAFVQADYEAQGGAVAADLLEENSVLEDLELVSTILETKLRDAAEAERARLGFAWADAIPNHDWNMFAEYGRVYPGAIEPDEAGQARLDVIAAEVANLEERRDAEDVTDEAYEEIYEQIEALSEEADALQTAYAPEDLAQAGVVATWNNGVQLSIGLIRPEDVKAEKAKSGEQNTEAEADDSITYTASLDADLKTERGMVLGAALATAPDTASDLAMFKLVCDVLLAGSSVTQAFGIRAAPEYPTHAKIDEIDQTPSALMDAACAELSLDWAAENASPIEMFAGFRAMEAGEKAKLVAYALGKTVQPCFARHGHSEQLMGAIEAEVMPDIRAFWKPTAAFFVRLKKAQLIKILSDLGLSQEALNLASSKKNDVVDFLDQLFTEPFATLTAEQRAAVDAWCPPGMQTAEVKVLAMKPAKQKRSSKKPAKAA